jgi:hypothetical protein
LFIPAQWIPEKKIRAIKGGKSQKVPVTAAKKKRRLQKRTKRLEKVQLLKVPKTG